MISNTDFGRAMELIRSSRRILLTTHTKPDGDACGCLAALCDSLAELGKDVKPLVLSPIPQWYHFLFADKVPVLGEDCRIEQMMAGDFGRFDLILIVDTNSRIQLGEFWRYLAHSEAPVLVFDHHATADGLGTVEVNDPSAAATGLIMFDFLRHARRPLTPAVAEALFVAVATDTGWFQFSNTNSRVYRTCAELIDAGANPTRLFHILYQTFSLPRFKLMLAMLETLELHLDARFATQHITQADFERTGSTPADTENLINECHRIGTVEASALFIELGDGRIRCSLRSTSDVDVSSIAAKFGGGGHKMAAGTYLAGPLGRAKNVILAEMTERLGPPKAQQRHCGTQ